MQVLVCLAENSGQVISKEQLMRVVWSDTFVTEEVLTRCISDLRRAMHDDAKEPRIIETIPRRGYRLVLPVQPAKVTRRRWSSPYTLGSVGALLIALIFSL